MRHATTAVIVGVLLLAGVVTAQQKRTQDVDLQAAIRTETVDGDLKGAIEQYKKIATAGDRAVAAQALVRMAECYQKLGDSDARTTYERILRDFADQEEPVTLARARLGTLGTQTQVRGDRVAWTGANVDDTGRASPDGRYITFVDWGGPGKLMVHDLVTNTDRALTAERSSEWPGSSAFSKDGKQIVYEWRANGRVDLHVLRADVTTIAEPRTLLTPPDDIDALSPYDWSRDGRWIAVNIHRRDGTAQIGLVAAADGALRVLKSVDWRGASKIVFSPDDRYLAYDLAATETNDERHVFVMAIDGSSESAVVADHSTNVVMGWSADGQTLLFASDRSGETALWGQRVTNGTPQGRPELLKKDIGSSSSLGLTSSESMLVYKPSSANFVQVAALDLDRATIRPTTGKPFQKFIGSGGYPSWSSDGKYLVYQSCKQAPNPVCAINKASIESGEAQQGWPKLPYLNGLQVAADGRSYTAYGRDLKGRGGLWRIDGQSLELSPIVTPRTGTLERVSPDEKTLYFRRNDPRGAGFFARDLATGVERQFFRLSQPGSMTLSPDGLYVATRVHGGNGSGDVLSLVPTAGGAAREILRGKKDEEFDGFRAEWTPDGRALVLPLTRGAAIELWIVPMFDAGAPRKIDVDTTGWLLPGGGFAIRPGGRQIAYVGMAGKQGAEVWVLENFLPAREGKP